MREAAPDPLPWVRLGMDREDWQRLADAFYALAHGDGALFDRLPALLKEHTAGVLCARYLEERDPALLEEAGYLLTGSRQWYVCLGR